MEEIVGLIVEEIDVLPWKVPGSFIEWNWVPSTPLDIQWKLDVSSLIFFCGDKCKYILDFRKITNFEIHLLFLVAGLLEEKTFTKGLVDVYIFHQPIALSKARRFQNNSERWKKR